MHQTNDFGTTTKKTVAAFDFDGTITTKDSLFLFLFFQCRPITFLRNAIPALYYVLLYKLKLIPNFVAKEALFSLFFKGMTLTAFNKRCEQFLGCLQKNIRQEAELKLRWHQSEEHEVVIISASIENWLLPLARQFGIGHLLATKIEVKSGVLTGKFLSKNCFGPEKVSRLLERFPDRENYTLYGYGDSKGDRELLAEADYPFFRSF